MAQHSQNSTVVVADIHMGMDTQSVHRTVDQEEVCSIRHTMYHNKHIHLTSIVTYVISIFYCYYNKEYVQDVYITCKERFHTYLYVLLLSKCYIVGTYIYIFSLNNMKPIPLCTIN